MYEFFICQQQIQQSDTRYKAVLSLFITKDTATNDSIFVNEKTNQ